MGKNLKKKIGMYNWITLVYTWNQYNIVSQLYFNFFFKDVFLTFKEDRWVRFLWEPLINNTHIKAEWCDTCELSYAWASSLCGLLGEAAMPVWWGAMGECGFYFKKNPQKHALDYNPLTILRLSMNSPHQAIARNREYITLAWVWATQDRGGKSFMSYSIFSCDTKFLPNKAQFT